MAEPMNWQLILNKIPLIIVVMTKIIAGILAHIESDVGADAPLTDIIIDLSGVNMGVPSVSGLTSKTNIEGYYTTAGYTATETHWSRSADGRNAPAFAFPKLNNFLISEKHCIFAV